MSIMTTKKRSEIMKLYLTNFSCLYCDDWDDLTTRVTVVVEELEAACDWERELRFLARSFWTALSAASARSSASSSSIWTLRYLARFRAATSSCKNRELHILNRFTNVPR